MNIANLNRLLETPPPSSIQLQYTSHPPFYQVTRNLPLTAFNAAAAGDIATVADGDASTSSRCSRAALLSRIAIQLRRAGQPEGAAALTIAPLAAIFKGENYLTVTLLQIPAIPCCTVCKRFSSTRSMQNMHLLFT